MMDEETAKIIEDLEEFHRALIAQKVVKFRTGNIIDDTIELIKRLDAQAKAPAE